MTIHCLGRLRAPVALNAVKILSSDVVLAENALEDDAAPQRFSGVVAHNFIVVPSHKRDSGNCDQTLEAGDA
jgi:hypothetical protein